MTDPTLTLHELDERIACGLRVRLLWSPVSPSKAFVEIYEGLGTTQPNIAYEVAGEKASDAFMHPYAFAP